MQTAQDRQVPRPPALGDTNPALVALYALLTFGLYLPIWYWSRLRTFHGLGSRARIRGRTVFALLLVGAVHASGVLSFVGGTDVRSVVLLGTVGHVLTFASGMLLVALRLRVREMLLEVYGERFSTRPRLSWIASVILGEIYLQDRLNRLAPLRPERSWTSPADPLPWPGV